MYSVVNIPSRLTESTIDEECEDFVGGRDVHASPLSPKRLHPDPRFTTLPASFSHNRSCYPTLSLYDGSKTMPHHVSACGAIQSKTMFISNSPPATEDGSHVTMSVKTRAKLAFLIAVSIFLALFACLLTIYIVVERIISSKGGVTYEQQYQHLPVDRETTTFGSDPEYPRMETPSSRRVFLPPRVNETGVTVFHDLTNDWVIIRNDNGENSVCYLKPLSLDDLPQPISMHDLLRHLSSPQYVNSLLQLQEDYVYESTDPVLAWKYGQKVEETCGHSLVYSLLPASEARLILRDSRDHYTPPSAAAAFPPAPRPQPLKDTHPQHRGDSPSGDGVSDWRPVTYAST